MKPLYTPAFIALYLANFCLVSSFAAFFLFPLYITACGGSREDIGIIMGAFALASALCRPWVAQMVDNIGRKRSYTIGIVIMLVLPLLYTSLSGAIAADYPLLLLLRVVHGVGLAICFTTIFTFIVDLIPPQRLNEGLGVFGTSGLLGLAVGPLLAEPVLHNYGFAAMFLCAAALAAAALLLQLPVRDRHRRDATRPQNSPTFFALLKTRKQMLCALLALLFGFGLAATGNFIAPFAAQRGLGLVSLYYLAYSCAAIGIRFIAGKIADRLGERQIIPWGLACASAGLLLLPLASGQIMLLLAGLVFGVGHGLLFPALNALAVRDEPYNVRGKVTGIFTGGIDTGIFCGALVLGIIGEQAGYAALFVSAAIMVAAGLLLWWRSGYGR